MRYLLIVLSVSLAVVACAAQDKPIAEITGAYQYNHLNLTDSGLSGSLNLSHGWDGTVNVPVTRWFGAVVDVGHVWKTESADSATATTSVYTYGGGPQLTYRGRYALPFVRGIFGDAHSSVFAAAGGVSASASIDSFFAAIGTGADFRIMHNVWFRFGADYFHTSKFGASVNGARAFAGLTYTFGRKVSSSDQAPAPTPSQVPAKRATGAGTKIDALGIMAAIGRGNGAEITEVVPNGVSALAGLHPGDVINSVDGKPIKSPMELAAELSSRKAGDKVRLGYSLHGQWQAETVVVLP